MPSERTMAFLGPDFSDGSATSFGTIGSHGPYTGSATSAPSRRTRALGWHIWHHPQGWSLGEVSHRIETSASGTADPRYGLTLSK
jgi:hypothetical protein